MVFTAGAGVIDAVIIFLIVVPLGGFVLFARWFLKRDDDGNPQ